MKASELVTQLQELIAEHGDLEVLAERYGDYLDSNPKLKAEKRYQYPWTSGWIDFADDDPEDQPTAEALVCYLAHY